MAKNRKGRVHLNKKNEIDYCEASERICRYEHFDTREGAETALALREVRGQLELAREELNAVLSNPNTPQTYGPIDFKKFYTSETLRDYANRIETYEDERGEPSIIQRCKLTLNQTNTGDNPRVAVTVERRVVPDYDNGVMGAKWVMNMRYTSGVKETETLELDLNNDREDAFRQARNFLQESVIANSTTLYDDQIERQTNIMMRQLREAHTAVEEQAQGPYEVYQQFGWSEGIGSFHESDASTVKVNVEFNSSTYSAKQLERFISENRFYQVEMPELDLRVYDTSGNRRRDEWWAVVNQNGQWYIDSQAKGEAPVRTPVDNPEAATRTLRTWLNSNMIEEGKFAPAKERLDTRRLVWLEDYMVKTEGVLRRCEAQFAAERERERQLAEASNLQAQNDSLFGKKKASSTMGKLFDMFN